MFFLCQLEKVESREEATTKEVERLHNVLYENTGVRRSFLEVLLFISNELIFFYNSDINWQNSFMLFE